MLGLTYLLGLEGELGAGTSTQSPLLAKGQRNNFSVISGPVVGQEPPLFGSSGPESTGP